MCQSSKNNGNVALKRKLTCDNCATVDDLLFHLKRSTTVQKKSYENGFQFLGKRMRDEKKTVFIRCSTSSQKAYALPRQVIYFDAFITFCVAKKNDVRIIQ